MQDFQVEDFGTIVRISPITENCQDWCDEHVEVPDYMLIGFSHAFNCDHRMAQPIIDALIGEGFNPEA